jgi:hypothetical protein
MIHGQNYYLKYITHQLYNSSILKRLTLLLYKDGRKGKQKEAGERVRTLPQESHDEMTRAYHEE